MCMAQVIEFATLARVTPRVRWSRDEQLGKVFPFMAQRDESEEPDCVARVKRSIQSPLGGA